MKTFMVFYCGAATDEEKANLKPENEKRLVQAWGKWHMGNIERIVDHGAPLGKTTRVDLAGVSASRNQVGAYVVVKADSKEEAAKLFLDHPHLSFFKGNWIEIMDCLPMPQPT